MSERSLAICGASSFGSWNDMLAQARMYLELYDLWSAYFLHITEIHNLVYSHECPSKGSYVAFSATFVFFLWYSGLLGSTRVYPIVSGFRKSREVAVH
jgi:hypothetical protein